MKLLKFKELPIVPVKTIETSEGPKREPLVEWGPWIDGRQSEDERARLLEWIKEENLDVAIIGGHYVEGRGYFFCIDFDLPYEQVLERLRHNKKLITYLEKTRRGRLHAYYFSTRPVPTKSFRNIPVELLGRGHLIIVSPSQGYAPLNDNTPRVVEDALDLFTKICESLGYDIHDYFVDESRETEVDKKILDEWLDKIVEELKRRGLYRGKGPNYYYSLCPFHAERNPSFAINHRRYYAIDYHDGRVYKLLDLGRVLGLELVTEIGDEEIKRIKRHEKFIVGGEVLDGRYLMELVESDGIIKLLVYDLESGEIAIHETFEYEGTIYRGYPHTPFKLPGPPEKVDEDPPLWRDTLEFIREYYDNPRTDDTYHVLTAVVAWSYFVRIVRTSTPFVLFLGPWRSGKTRALEVMASLCHRAMLLVDPSEASIFRLVEELRPTLIIDEAQVIDQNVRAIMAAAYRYGMKVPRVIKADEEGLDAIRWYDVFSLIIYASREEAANDIFSRSVLIRCEKSTRQTRKIIDEERARQLRTRWLAQRLRMYNKLKVTFEEFESSDGRLQELFSPLLVMARVFGNEEAVKAVERYGRNIEQEIFGMETTTDEALIVEAILKLINSRKDDAPEYILVNDLAHELNNGLERETYTPAYVGKRLAALGFRRKRVHGGRVAYIVDFDLLQRLATRYNVVYEAVLA